MDNSLNIFPSTRLHAGPKRADRRAGQIIIFVTLSLFFLFSVMGLAVDLGYSYYTKVAAQSAADAAATAAATYASNNGYACTTNIDCSGPYTCPNTLGAINTAFKAGCAYAQSNGFTGGGSQTVTMSANSTASPFVTGVSTALWIQANVAQTVPHLFLYWSGFHSGSVATQSISAITVTPNSSCIYVLDSGNTAGALTVSGAAVLTAQSCGIYVNSSNAAAINVMGSARIIASQISVVGRASCTVAAVCNPVPTTGSSTVTDPLSGMTPPAVGACGPNNYALGSSNAATIQPSSTAGVYCGGISVTGAAHLTLHTGTYILKDGGFSVGNSGIVTADGPVTIYMQGSATKPANLALTGASAVTLSAPSSGAYQGILFYQDPSLPGNAASSVGNSAALTATGTMYFPKTALTLSGAVGTGQMAVVVKDLTVANSATFQQDLTGASTGLALKSATLIQ